MKQAAKRPRPPLPSAASGSCARSRSKSTFKPRNARRAGSTRRKLVSASKAGGRSGTRWTGSRRAYSRSDPVRPFLAKRQRCDRARRARSRDTNRPQSRSSGSLPSSYLSLPRMASRRLASAVSAFGGVGLNWTCDILFSEARGSPFQFAKLSSALTKVSGPGRMTDLPRARKLQQWKTPTAASIPTELCLSARPRNCAYTLHLFGNTHRRKRCDSQSFQTINFSNRIGRCLTRIPVA